MSSPIVVEKHGGEIPLLSYDKLTDKSFEIALRKYTHTKRNKIVYYTPNASAPPIPLENEITAEDLENEFGKTATRYPKHFSKLKQELIARISDDVMNMTPLNTLRINDKSEFVPMVNSIKSERYGWFITAPSGSGKTHFALRLLDFYLFEGISKKRIFLICNKDDPKYRGKAQFVNISEFVESDRNESYEAKMDKYREMKIRYRHKRKNYSPEERIELEIELEKLKPTAEDKSKGFQVTQKFKKLISSKEPSVFVFDDIEALPSTEMRKAYYLAGIIGDSERKTNVNLIFLHHKLVKGKETIKILEECSHIVVFKRSRGGSIQYMLDKYLALGLKTRKRILNSKAKLKDYQYLMICTRDDYVMTSKEIYLI